MSARSRVTLEDVVPLAADLDVSLPPRWDCEGCGGALTLTTRHPQSIDDPSGCDWYAYEDDEAVCNDCGAVHRVHVEADDGAYLRAVPS